MRYHITMNEQTQTPNPKNEVEVGTEFIFNAEPEGLDAVRMAAVEGLQRVVSAAKLEVRMLAFDALHGTHYRQIRHDLMAQAKREKFERSIGLVAIKK